VDEILLDAPECVEEGRRREARGVVAVARRRRDHRRERLCDVREKVLRERSLHTVAVSLAEQRGVAQAVAKRMRACEQLPEREAQAVQVDPRVVGHERIGQELRSGVGERRRPLGNGRLAQAVPEELPAAPVDELRHPRRPEDVLGLDVAVDDTVRVRDREAARDLDGHLEGPQRMQRAVLEQTSQGGPLEQIHHEVAASLVGAVAEHADDAGVVDRSEDLGLDRATARAVGIAVDRLELDRDRGGGGAAARSTPDFALVAPPDEGEQLASTDDLAGTSEHGMRRIAHRPISTSPP
jgi:hypothetical protein